MKTGILIQKIILLAAVVLLSACAHEQRSWVQNIPCRTGKQSMPLNIRLLPGAPLRAAETGMASAKWNDQGYLEVQFPVVNCSSCMKRFSYRWQWVGPTGMVNSDPLSSTWQVCMLARGESNVIRGISTVSDPVAGNLQISSNGD